MTQQIEFSLPAYRRGCHLITHEIISHIPQLPEQGLLNLFICHTSCALSINENFDPDVRTDLSNALNRIAPDDDSLYNHTDEGPDDMPSHIKSSLIGASLSIPIRAHHLALGTWQGIYLCEFRNHGSSRKIIATILS